MRLATLALCAASLCAQVTLPQFRGVIAGAEPVYTDYVDSVGGLDANPGTKAAPKQTLAGIPALSAGDSVGLKRGSTFREQLTAGASGSAGSPITYGAYGSGAKPIINGSDVVTGWQADQTSYTLQDDVVSSASIAGGSFPFNWSYGGYASGWTAGASYTLTRACFKLKTQVGSPYTTPITAKILSSSNGTPSGTPDTLLGTSSATQQYTTTGIFAYYCWDFAGVSITSGTTYYAALSASTNTDTNYTYFAGAASTGWTTYCRTTGAWGPDVSNQQKAVRTYATGASGAANVWNATLTSQPDAVRINGTLGKLVASKAALASAHDWFWAGNVLSIYEPTDPTAMSVEAATRAAIYTNNRSYLTFRDLAIQKTNGVAVLFRNAANIIVSRCDISDTSQDGIDGYQVSSTLGDLLVQDSTFTNIGMMGTGGQGPSGVLYGFAGATGTVTVERCTFTNVCPNTVHGHSMYVQGGNSVYRYNVTHGNSGDSAPSNPGLSGGAGPKISADSPGVHYIHHNVVDNRYGKKTWGLDIDGGTGEAAVVYFYHNTVVNAYNGTIFGGLGGAIHSKNNIFVRGADSDAYISDDNAAATATYDGDYNLYYDGTGSGTNRWYWRGAPYTTLAAFKTASGEGAHSTVANPLFTNYAGYDFTLQAGSPAIGAGVYLEGISTANPPNIGAR